MALVMLTTTSTHSIFYIYKYEGDINNIVLGAGAIFYLLYWMFLVLLDLYFANMIIFYAQILFEEDAKKMKAVKIIVVLATGLMLLFDFTKMIKYVMYSIYYFGQLSNFELNNQIFEYIVTIDMYITAVSQF